MNSSGASAREQPLALITGASAGLGAAFARAFAARGYDLVLVARRKERLDALAVELAAEYGVDAHVIVADLSLADSEAPILAALAEKNLRPTALVNNAGYSLPQTFLNTTWQQQRDFIMTLVMSVCSLTHALLPAMVQRGAGRIIMLGSMAALSPGGAGHTLYPAAKSFVNKFALSLDAEVRGKGVRVTCVNPGITETEFQTANNTKEIMAGAPRFLRMSAEDVVARTLRANDRGQVIYVPGLLNKLGAVFMRHLPDALVIPVIRGAADKYRMPEE